MSIEYQLLRQGRVVFYQMEPVLDLTKMDTLANRLKVEVFNHATSPVYVIIDLNPIRRVPPSVLSSCLSMMRRVNSGASASRTILITDKGFLRTMAQLLDKAAPNKVIVKKTLEEALEAVDELLTLEA